MTARPLCALLLFLAMGLSGCSNSPRLITFTTPNGSDGRALYALPPVSAKRPVPVVIYNHGRLIHGDDFYLSAAMGYDIRAFVQELASEGYAVIAPIRRPAATSDENADLLAGAMDYVKDQASIDATRVGILAFSLGGGPSFRASAEMDDIKALVLISPRIPPQDVEDKLGSVSAPVLILYGKKDLDGVIETADRVLIPGMIALQKKFQVRNDFNVRHRWFMKPHAAYWKEIVKFLTKYLKT